MSDQPAVSEPSGNSPLEGTASTSASGAAPGDPGGGWHNPTQENAAANGGAGENAAPAGDQKLLGPGTRPLKKVLKLLGSALGQVNRHRVCAVLAPLLAMYLANKYSRIYYRSVVDDAMTSVQYARNLALGNGVVFNVGERVEGYTNFLWVLLMAPFYWVARLFQLEFVHMVIAVSIVLSGIALLLVYRLAREIWDRNIVATVTALGLCVVDNSYTAWAAFALENHLLAVCILSAIYFARSKSPKAFLWTGIALACAQATRPDAALFCACVVGSEAVEVLVRTSGAGRSSFKRQLMPWLKMVGVWLALYGLYFAWRYSYYGLPFPNTYYTKLAGPNFDGWQRGWLYVQSFFEDRSWIYAAGIGGVLMIRDRSVRTLWTYAIVHTVYVAYVGGDFFPGHRFFVSQIPVFSLLVGAFLAGLWSFLNWPRLRRLLERRELPPLVFAGATTVAVGAAMHRVWELGLERGPLVHEIKAWRQSLLDSRTFLKWLKDHKPPNAKVATGLIGNSGYWSEAYIVDMFSIIDPVTARMPTANFGKGKAGHEKQAPREYMLGRKPDVIVPGYYYPGHWNDGYYFDTDVPKAGIEGIWRRDTLLESGTLVREAMLSFDSGSEQSWTAEGNAFEQWPSYGPGTGQGPSDGSSGAYANSYHSTIGDSAIGRLVSQPFTLSGDLLVFRLGGGNAPDKLFVSLIVDGARVRIATGHDGEAMGRKTWDIKEFHGKQGMIEIHDGADGGWGHITADEFAQWTASGKTPVANQ
jgi:hypothetical protein